MLGSGAQCSHEARWGDELCAYHGSMESRRERRAYHLARLSAEDQEALGPAAGLEGLDSEIAMLRVLIRRALPGGVEAVRGGVDSLCRVLLTRRQLDAGDRLAVGAGLGAVLEALGEGEVRPDGDRPRQEAEAVALAVRHQRGDRGALEALYRLLEAAILAALLDYRALQPPGAITMGELQARSRIVLAELVGPWRPGVSFLGYFFRTFPRAIERHFRRAQRVGGPAGGAADADPAASGRKGAFSAEDLAALPELERQIVYLRVFEGEEMPRIARQVGLPVGTAYRLYQRGRGRLRPLDAPEPARAASGERHAARTRSTEDLSTMAIRRLVQALHAAAGPGGRLPGREWAMAAAGLKRLEFDRLIARLEGARAIYGRGRRNPGHLVERTAAATLARLGDGETERDVAAEVARLGDGETESA